MIARSPCGRAWVRNPVKSNQKTIELVFVHSQLRLGCLMPLTIIFQIRVRVVVFNTTFNNISDRVRAMVFNATFNNISVLVTLKTYKSLFNQKN
jgi:hypothetical protein